MITWQQLILHYLRSRPSGSWVLGPLTLLVFMDLFKFSHFRVLYFMRSSVFNFLRLTQQFLIFDWLILFQLSFYQSPTNSRFIWQLNALYKLWSYYHLILVKKEAVVKQILMISHQLFFVPFIAKDYVPILPFQGHFQLNQLILTFNHLSLSSGLQLLQVIFQQCQYYSVISF